MAFSPRNELVIESVVVFAHFPEGWVWAERAPDGSVELDSGERAFADYNEAINDFLEDRGIDPDKPVPAEEAHYEMVIPVGENEIHVRKYRYGAPKPLQVVS